MGCHHSVSDDDDVGRRDGHAYARVRRARARECAIPVWCSGACLNGHVRGDRLGGSASECDAWLDGDACAGGVRIAARLRP